MTDTLIKLRRSAVPGKIPTDVQLQLGEVAINTYDGKMFFKQAAVSNSVVQVATTSNGLNQFASTTSAQLAGVISDKTGTGSLVFATNPMLIAPVISGNTNFDSNTLFVDSVNNRIGVNTASPSQALHVTGNVLITGGIADSNGNFGSPGQVLASNTSGIYWSTAGAGGGSTNLTASFSGTTVSINSDTGTDATITGANSTSAGVITNADQTIAGIKTYANNAIFNGSIGIGTSTPATTIDIRGTGSSYTTPINNTVPTITAYNTNNANTTAHSILLLRTGGVSGGDPFISFDITGEQGYSIGVDNTDNMFKISGNWSNVATSTRFVIDASGNAGIGTSTPSTLLQVAGEVTAVDFNTTSDINVKKNVEPIINAVAKVSQINGVTFSFINDPTEQRHAGVIAQDVEKVLPEAVKELNDGIKHVAYGNLIGLLIEAIKEQQKQIDDLKSMLNK